MDFIDLRSDTVTWPTEDMRSAMANAVVGDDVWGDDPTVIELEKLAARIVGTEAALFVPSGTMGNQLALLTHCKRGGEVVIDDDCHIIQHEAGAGALISGVQMRCVTGIEKDGKTNVLEPSMFEAKIRRSKDIHEPETTLITYENARSCGRVFPLSFMEEMKEISIKHQVPIHLDGARLFNAAATLGVDAKEIVKKVDSVMFCLSKGLCAPIGSILAGKADFIEKAKWNRKILGGAMRQSGVLAAAGILALKEMAPKLKDDHSNAHYIANELAKMEHVVIDPSHVEINMVFFKFKGVNTDSLVDYLGTKGIKVGSPAPDGTMRFVTHHWITLEKAKKVVEEIKNFIS